MVAHSFPFPLPLPLCYVYPMDIVTLGHHGLAQELNYLIGPYHEFDQAFDVDDLAHCIKYRDAVVIDLDCPDLIFQAQELLRTAPLVIVLTNGNGDMRDMRDLIEGFNCRFLQKPVTKSGWQVALNPHGRMSLMVPDLNTGTVLKIEAPVVDIPKKKRKPGGGRPKGARNKSKLS